MIPFLVFATLFNTSRWRAAKWRQEGNDWGK